MSDKVLIIDDEADIRFLVKYNLEKEGYIVFEAENGIQGIEIAEKESPSIILLDVMMPEMDGIETCEKIRMNKDLDDILICFLTARGEDYSQIAGFDAGADYYITKPIKPKVLVSRIGAMLRRKRKEVNAVDREESVNPEIVLNREKYRVVKDNEIINLPRKEFELLALLASDPNKVFKREEILEK